MVLVQKWPFFQLCFFSQYRQENVFYDILERKDAFLRYKNKKFIQSKNWHFSKRVKPWFWSKNGYFSNFDFLANIGQENVFYDILERKNAFLSYKNKKFKTSKNWHFSKRVYPMVLVQKWPFFQLWFFSQYRSGNSLLRYSGTKKCLSKL